MAELDKGLEKNPTNVKTITYGGLTWVDIVQPSEESTRYLAEKYHFHPLDLDDTLSRRQLSKIEEYPEYLFIIFHLPVYDKETRVSTKQQWSVFVGDTYLVTLRPGALKTITEIFQQCELNEGIRREYFSQGSGYLLYQLLDVATDYYFTVLDKILSLMDEIEDSVFDEEIEVAKEVSILRRDIITQRRVMIPTRAIIIDLENKLKRFAKADLSVYFSDLIDHLNKICETLDECREIIEVFKDADSILGNSRTNRIIRTLATIVVIGIPFIVVSSLYGMQVILPGGIEKGSIQTFLILLLIMLVLTGGLLFILRRKHLL